MSELINNSQKRKELLKHMILQLHEGQAPDAVKKQLIQLLGQVPYGEVVEVEQELISEGLPQEEVLKLCDVHTQALKGIIDQEGAREAPPGHPVHTFTQENRALQLKIAALENLFRDIEKSDAQEQVDEIMNSIHTQFNFLTDVEKHYRRKENLLFPYLERYEITGPPTVMWGKHDETRELIKAAIEALAATKDISAEEAKAVIEFVLKPTMTAIEEMIYKEEQILFPMCMDILTDNDWYEIYNQSLEIGFCLYDPVEKWIPEGLTRPVKTSANKNIIKLPSGTFNAEELNVLLNTIPFDMTFVDKNDIVRYFTQGKERIFDRNRAILGRKVQLCHPPASVHVIERILDDFRSGKQDSAAFWITLDEKFIHIEYFAMRNENGDYLGTLEVSQDLTEKRKLEGEKRILDYNSED